MRDYLMKDGPHYFSLTVAILVAVAVVLAFLDSLRGFLVVFLAAAFVSLILLMIVGVGVAFNRVKMKGDSVECAKEVGILLGVLTASLGILFATGQFYSLRMTLDMPSAYSSTVSYRFGDYGSLKLDDLSEELPPLKGNKAVTIHANFGAYADGMMKTVALVTDFPREKLFRYSDQYIPSQYQASSYSDVGYLVIVRNRAERSDSVEYTSGAIPYAWCIDVGIYDGESMVASTTIEGNYRPTTSLKSGPVIGPAPEEEVREWVANELERLIDG